MKCAYITLAPEPDLEIFRFMCRKRLFLSTMPRRPTLSLFIIIGCLVAQLILLLLYSAHDSSLLPSLDDDSHLHGDKERAWRVRKHSAASQGLVFDMDDSQSYDASLDEQDATTGLSIGYGLRVFTPMT